MRDSPVKALPGLSAMRFLMIGIGLGLPAAACVVPLLVVLRSGLAPLLRDQLVAGVLVLAGILLVASLTATMIGYSKLRREGERGYTTSLGIALKDRTLYLLDSKTLAVLSAPGEPRPKPGRRRPS